MLSRSSAGCIISITRLLEHFNDENTKKFKQLLMNELGCTNETQLWHRILPSLSHLMTNESLMTLKEETIKIAEQQQSNNCTTISVYKQVQKKYKDKLSNLHSDIIDYLATFLEKQESIELGYLNKQLYIETQKQSYLLKRHNDDTFLLSSGKIHRLYWKHSNPFSYSLPHSVNICVSTAQKYNRAHALIQSSQWYQNMFSVLNAFTCNHFGYLAAVPIEKFFSKNINNEHVNYKSKYKQNNCRRSGRLQQIEKFQCMSNKCDEYIADMKDSAQKFCNNFQQYYNSNNIINNNTKKNINNVHVDTTVSNCSCDNNNKIRGIKQLIIGRHVKTTRNDPGMKSSKQILLTLGPISDKISIQNGSICIDNQDEFMKIFHPRLKVFEFDDTSEIILSNKINDNDKDDIDNLDLNFDGLSSDGGLQLSFIVGQSLDIYKEDSFTKFVNQLQSRGIRLWHEINCFTLTLLTSLKIHESWLRTVLLTVFNMNIRDDTNDTNEIGAYDDNQHIDNICNIINIDIGTQKRVVVKIGECTPNLWHVAKVLEFLTLHRSKIFNKMNSNVSNVSFELSFAEYSLPITAGNWESEMWSYTSDVEYSTDENKIEYKECDLSQE